MIVPEARWAAMSWCERIVVLVLVVLAMVCGMLGSRRAVAYYAVFNLWVQIGIFLVSTAISYALQKRPPTPKPTAFEEIPFPQFDEGTPQAVIFGDVWTEDWMVLGVGNYRTTPIKKGGK